ncbi:hypothetical protein KJY73_15025 [Bowmanella sp. Y26]|uniref:hypothetical protein n=1 Tax=Bowmanella yangjiangensis TaxID=2811230 RepID=UPI001BDD57DD|nr:hypothetical protein [Bowmanella yangjiangensis]MBT1064904.1 hypothetical protein [Bowmanella yangjiangensis]
MSVIRPAALSAILCVLNAFAAPFELGKSASLFYALETVSAQQTENILISSAGDTLNVKFPAGFSLSSDPRYVRIDLVNGQFAAALPAAGLAASADYTSLLSAGGAVGDNFAIVQVSAAVPKGPETPLVLPLTSIQIGSPAQPLTFVYTLFDSASSAVNKGLYLHRGQAELLHLQSGLSEAFAQGFEHRVGFGTDFVKFSSTFRSPAVFSLGDSDGDKASLAKFRADLLIQPNARKVSDSSIISDFRDLLSNVNSKAPSALLQGDFSAGNLHLNAADNCGGASHELSVQDGAREAKVSLDNLISFPVLCMDVSENRERIVRSEYRLNLGLGADAAYFGRVRYDGARVDLPYISGFGEYRQRITLVNHTGYNVRYITEFFAEQAVQGNFEPGSLSQGVIPAKSALKLDATDLVSIVSGVPTRVSARILLDALPEDVSASVQIVAVGSGQPPMTNVLQILSN